MFTGLTPEICARAWDTLQPSISYAHDHDIFNRYIGAIDPQGHVIHSMVLPDGRSSAALLKHLR